MKRTVVAALIAAGLLATSACHSGAGKIHTTPPKPHTVADVAIAAASQTCSMATPCMTLNHCEDSVGTVIKVGPDTFICVHNAAQFGYWN